MKPVPKKRRLWSIRRLCFQATLIIAASIFFNSCTHFSGTANVADVMSDENSQKSWRLDTASENFAGLFASSATQKFYRSNRFVPVWMQNKSNTMLADSMLYFIRMARMFGLEPEAYHLHELEDLMRQRDVFSDSVYINKIDLLFTDAFFTFTNHLRYGRITPDSLKRYKSSVMPDSMQVALLESALKRNELTRIFSTVEPAYSAYQRLKSALRQMIENSDSLSRRMLLAGYDQDSSEVFFKVRTLEVNMERWRWEHGLTGRHIAVNIPAFVLELIEDDSVIMRSKVIVGTSKNQTPELDGLIKTFTIYPYWNVTRNIAVKEMLPNIKKDSAYLEAHHYEVLDISGAVLDPTAIDWTQYHSNNFPFTLRQKQGVHNALGLIKFTFDNPYAVYVHDTNARLMFRREKRALSHGCVRLEKALELGRLLVRNDDLVTPEDLDQYLQMQKQITIRVNPIPIHLRYFTCDVQGDSVVFFNDVYNRDALIKDALSRPKVVAAR